MSLDVPSPIDLRLMSDARPWAETALARRPVRPEFFDAFAREIGRDGVRVLELGSGPGFLAGHLLRAWPGLAYVALDFSPAMHQLAAERLGERAAQVRFVERSFREPAWGDGLGPFDVVVTHQAVHELRHKTYATALHAQVRPLLAAGGRYLVCDHFLGEGGLSNDQLYMTVDEQRDALLQAGWRCIARADSTAQRGIAEEVWPRPRAAGGVRPSPQVADAGLAEDCAPAAT